MMAAISLIILAVMCSLAWMKLVGRPRPAVNLTAGSTHTGSPDAAAAPPAVSDPAPDGEGTEAVDAEPPPLPVRGKVVLFRPRP